VIGLYVLLTEMDCCSADPVYSDYVEHGPLQYRKGFVILALKSVRKVFYHAKTLIIPNNSKHIHVDFCGKTLAV
jgi:hypothetical protein